MLASASIWNSPFFADSAHVVTRIALAVVKNPEVNSGTVQQPR